MALAFSQFGSASESLYAAYLLTHDGCSCSVGVASGERVFVDSTSSFERSTTSFGSVRALVSAYLQERCGECCGSVFARQQLDNAGSCGGGLRQYAQVCGVDGVSNAECSSTVDGCELAGDGSGSSVAVGGSGRVDQSADGQSESVVKGDTGTRHYSGSEGACAGVAGVASESSELGSGAGGVERCSESETVVVRGKNYVRNRRRRLARSVKGSSVPEWRRGAVPNGVVSEHRGVFAECSQEVQRELRESRARMLVAKNEAAVVQAKADKQKVEAMVKARVYELDVEARRLKLDKDRKKEITEALAVLPAGYAETIASEGLTSSVPSLSDGSVSPDSSISVAQVNRMEETIKHLTTRVAELTADNTEAEVKLKARIDRLEGELKCSERKVDMVGQQFRGLADERPARKQYVSPFSFV